MKFEHRVILYKIILGGVFALHFFYSAQKLEQRTTTEGAKEYNEIVSKISPSSEYYLYSNVLKLYEGEFFRPGVLGDNIYACLKNNNEAKRRSSASPRYGVFLQVIPDKEIDGIEVHFFKFMIHPNGVVDHLTYSTLKNINNTGEGLKDFRTVQTHGSCNLKKLIPPKGTDGARLR